MKLYYIHPQGLGLLLVLIYACRCWRNKAPFNQSVMISVIFHASGIVCGVLLIASTFFPALRERMTGIEMYILISGLAVLSVSVQGVHRDAIKSTSKEISTSP